MDTSMKVALGKVIVGGLVAWAGCAAGCADMDSSDSTADTVARAAALVQADSAKPGSIGGDAGPRCPCVMPAGLNPPADATLEAGMAAKGVQIYVCAVPAAGGAPAWTLKAPHAVLNQGWDTTAIHFAGPSWQALDGSLVTGTRVGSVAASDPSAIPWLLLQAATNVGPGLFGDVTWIQRLDTVGGAAPATGCDVDHVGAQVLIPYRANYFFYHPSADGVVRQCAAI